MILVRVVIPTDKLEETINFYQTILGTTFATAKDKAIAKVDNFLLSIVKNTSNNNFSPTGNGIYLDFLVSDAPSLQSRIPKSVVVSEWEEHGEKLVLTKDPNGNLILFHGYISTLSKEQQAFEKAGLKVALLASILNSFYFAVTDLISVLRKHGFRDDLAQKIGQASSQLGELLSRKKTYLSKIPQTQAEKEDFELYYKESSHSLTTMADNLGKILDVVSENSVLHDNVEIQKAIGLARRVFQDWKTFVELDEKP